MRSFGGIYFVEEWRKVKKKLKACGKTPAATASREADSCQARGLQHSNLARTGSKRLRILSALLPADSKELQWESGFFEFLFTARRIRERELRAVADALLNRAMLYKRNFDSFELAQRSRPCEETCQASFIDYVGLRMSLMPLTLIEMVSSLSK